ncbi:MAG: hypothetical protein K2Y29_19145 [Beijerinckiaceae bacterium]|nr:hypothetical protein [Beijerinckiaceae bacterium]
MRLLVFAAVILHALNASAQTEPDWRALLDDLYRIDMAFDACKDVTPSAADMLRLEGAITYVEEKTGLEDDDLDEIYGTIERESLANESFCDEMSDAVERMRAAPQEPQ